jgi:predicted RNA-binding protein YlqC (UPF0109 family)
VTSEEVTHDHVDEHAEDAIDAVDSSESAHAESEESEEDSAAAQAADERIRSLVEYVLDHLVSKPDEVQIARGENRRRPVYEVRVAPEDVGVVIGRSGRTINALRTLMAAVPSAPERVWLELVEEDEGEEAPHADGAEASGAEHRHAGEDSDHYDRGHDDAGRSEQPRHPADDMDLSNVADRSQLLHDDDGDSGRED